MRRLPRVLVVHLKRFQWQVLEGGGALCRCVRMRRCAPVGPVGVYASVRVRSTQMSAPCYSIYKPMACVLYPGCAVMCVGVGVGMGGGGGLGGGVCVCAWCFSVPREQCCCWSTWQQRIALQVWMCLALAALALAVSAAAVQATPRSCLACLTCSCLPPGAPLHVSPAWCSWGHQLEARVEFAPGVVA